MINDDLRERALKEAIRIAEDIYDKRIEDENGIRWKTMSFNLKKSMSIDWGINESIYSGVSGIALFYLALYRITGNKKYLIICKNTMKWVINYCKKNKTPNYAFLTGRSGVSYVLIKLSEICGENYLDEALELMKDCDINLYSGNTVCEYLNGASGTIIVLLHLYEISGEFWLLEKIDKYIKYIIDNLHYNYNGIHWDRNINSIKALCGFSHGAAGIGFVFLELGNYFNNPVFYYLAEQSFSYESNFFRDDAGNWADLRKFFITKKDYKEIQKAVETREYDYYYKESFMSAWCHGAPGIGLTRLRAYELLNKDIYKKEYKLSMDSVLVSDVNSISNSSTFTLCHGLAGNLEIVIEYLKKNNDSNIESVLYSLTQQMLDDISMKRKYMSGLFTLSGDDEDYSLFLGNAGIGYFYLRLIDSVNIDSIMIPCLEYKKNKRVINGNYIFNSQDYKKTKEIIIEKSYPKTLKIFRILFSKEYENYFSNTCKDTRINELFDFEEEIKVLLNGKTLKAKLFRDFFTLEKKKLEMDKNIESYALTNFRYTSLNERSKRDFEKDSVLVASNYSINPDVKLHEIDWKWNELTGDNFVKIAAKRNKKTQLILMATEYTVLEREISSFCYDLLRIIDKEKNLEVAINEFYKLCDINSEKDELLIRDKIIEQVRIFLKEGVILVD
jgi:hypothetical protein